MLMYLCTLGFGALYPTRNKLLFYLTIQTLTVSLIKYDTFQRMLCNHWNVIVLNIVRCKDGYCMLVTAVADGVVQQWYRLALPLGMRMRHMRMRRRIRCMGKRGRTILLLVAGTQHRAGARTRNEV